MVIIASFEEGRKLEATAAASWCPCPPENSIREAGQDRQHVSIGRLVVRGTRMENGDTDSGEYNVLHKTITDVVWDEDSYYNASHQLASDGVSAEQGKLTAHHDRNSTTTETEKGRHYSSSSSHESSSRFQDKSTTVSHLHQEDDFTYEDTSSGRELKGKATTTDETITSYKNTYHSDGSSSSLPEGRDVYDSRDEGTDTKEVVTTLDFAGTGQPVTTVETTHEGNDIKYSKWHLLRKLNGEKQWERWAQSEERQDWKTGAGVEDPYQTHNLHFWGEQEIEFVLDSTETLSAPVPQLVEYQNQNWTTQDITYHPQANGDPGAIKTWDATWDKDLPQPEAQSEIKYPGSVATMTDAEFSEFIDDLPDDLPAFNQALASLSEAERAAFHARIRAGLSEATVDEDSILAASLLGIGQGIANAVNGVQDAAIGLLNLPAMGVNGIAWLEEKAGILSENSFRLPYIPSPDWSKDLIVPEGEFAHAASKFLGSLYPNAYIGAKVAKFLKPFFSKVDDISTGRTAPINLKEKLVMQEARAGAGELIVPPHEIGDPRFAGNFWAKYQHIHKAPDGTNYVVHYMKNLLTNEMVDFKFVNP